LRYCVEHGYHLRFIEQMPLDPQHGWRRDELVTADEILAMLRKEFELTTSEAPRGSAPAERWRWDGGPADVGVIGSVTRPFCADCDRTRLTADGQLRNCLFSRSKRTCAARCGPARTTTRSPNAGRWGCGPSSPDNRINEAGFATADPADERYRRLTRR